MGLALKAADSHAESALAAGCQHVLAGLFEVPSAAASELVYSTLRRATAVPLPMAWFDVRRDKMTSRSTLSHSDRLALIGLSYYSNLEAVHVERGRQSDSRSII